MFQQNKNNNLWNTRKQFGKNFRNSSFCLYFIDYIENLIKEGKKTVEGRKGTPRWLNIKKGMLGTIINPKTEESFLVECILVSKYSTLIEYLETETIEKTLPYVSSIEEGEKIYLQWSTKKEIEEFGFLGIHLKCI